MLSKVSGNHAVGGKGGDSNDSMGGDGGNAQGGGLYLGCSSTLVQHDIYSGIMGNSVLAGMLGIGTTDGLAGIAEGPNLFEECPVP